MKAKEHIAHWINNFVGVRQDFSC